MKRIYVAIYRWQYGSIFHMETGKRIVAKNWNEAKKIANRRLETRRKKDGAAGSVAWTLYSINGL